MLVQYLKQIFNINLTFVKRNLTFVKTDFQVFKLKFHACTFSLIFYPFYKQYIA